MSYKALYRTYRPLQFDEVAGQKHIVQTLKNALKENKIAHAYLFCGPRGTGKTSMARIFAKALNCSTGFGNQCNECENCLAINEGRHPDVIEIDAASNRGIDDIRDLISKVKYAPILGKYKVYIIDEVHMMTTEAFNALLKTLEEPPKNVVFILATTEPYKLMPTILSRCQRYDFTKVSDGELYNRLFDICEKENVEIEEDALTLLVSLSDGGVRDALSMLDQTIAYAGNQIKVKDIQDLYGISSVAEKVEFMNALDLGDILKITSMIQKFMNSGIDLKRFAFDLLDILKDILIYHATKSDQLLKVLKRSDFEGLNITVEKANLMINILLETTAQFRLVSNISSLFEISMLKIASYKTLQEEKKDLVKKEMIEEIKKEIIVETKKEENVPPKVEAAPIEVKETPIVQPIIKEEPVIKEELVKPGAFQNPIAQNGIEPTNLPEGFNPVSFVQIQPLVEDGVEFDIQQSDLINIMVQATKEYKNRLNENWGMLEQLINNNRVGKYASMLKMTYPRIVSKDAVILESNFHSTIKRINIKENQYGLSKVIEALCGRQCLVLCISRDVYVEAVKKFTNLQQINKLPDPKPIEIGTFKQTQGTDE